MFVCVIIVKKNVCDIIIAEMMMTKRGLGLVSNPVQARPISPTSWVFGNR